MRCFEWNILFLGLMASVMAAADTHQPRPEINAMIEAELPADKSVHLMDIAGVEFVDANIAQQALNLELFPGRKDGETMTYKNVDLVRILRAKVVSNLQIADERWAYFVPEEVHYKFKKNAVATPMVRNQILQAIEYRCHGCKVSMHDLRIPQIHEHEAYQSCEIDTQSMKAGGSFLVPLQCQFSNEVKTYWISGATKITQLVPVATRQLSPGDKINERDLRLEEVDVSYAKDGIPRMEEVQGQLAAHFLSVNQPIFRADFKRDLAITRGQIVRAISGNESFEVTSQAVAEEQGYVGDLIRIKNSESQKILSGQVIDKGVVKVQ